MADTAGPPRYDPKKHGEDDHVSVEMFADDGSLFRRSGLVSTLREDAEQWIAHVQANGAKPASPQYALNVRSGTPPEEGTEGAADYSDTKVRPWPFDAAPDETREG